jgi:hypothetical protein
VGYLKQLTFEIQRRFEKIRKHQQDDEA